MRNKPSGDVEKFHQEDSEHRDSGWGVGLVCVSNMDRSTTGLESMEESRRRSDQRGKGESLIE